MGPTKMAMHASVQNLTQIVPILAQGKRQKPVPGRSRPSPSINCQENTVNQDQAKGRVKGVKGKVKEVAGRVSGDKALEQEGQLQAIVGKVQAGFGDLKEDIKKPG
jgi:uncharacterized protein YjbJ (UPF0337 family)